jgi:hypothetical protein
VKKDINGSARAFLFSCIEKVADTASEPGASVERYGRVH